MTDLSMLIETGAAAVAVALPIVALVLLLVRDDPFGFEHLGGLIRLDWELPQPHGVQEEYDVRWNVDYVVPPQPQRAVAKPSRRRAIAPAPDRILS